jgi:general stress protein CsbA
MVAFSGVALLGALIVSQMLPQYNQWAWFIGLQSITLSLGWALGPFLQEAEKFGY